MTQIDMKQEFSVALTSVILMDGKGVIAPAREASADNSLSDGKGVIAPVV